MVAVIFAMRNIVSLVDFNNVINMFITLLLRVFELPGITNPSNTLITNDKRWMY